MYEPRNGNDHLETGGKLQNPYIYAAPPMYEVRWFQSSWQTVWGMRP